MKKVCNGKLMFIKIKLDSLINEQLKISFVHKTLHTNQNSKFGSKQNVSYISYTNGKEKCNWYG